MNWNTRHLNPGARHNQPPARTSGPDADVGSTKTNPRAAFLLDRSRRPLSRRWSWRLAGLAASCALAVSAPAAITANLVDDPGFESDVSGFFPQDSSSSVTRTSASPIEGNGSLVVSITGYGNNVWWWKNYAGGLASHFSARARARSEIASSSSLQFCAMVYFEDGSAEQACTGLDGATGDKGTVSAELDLDPTKPLMGAAFRLYQEGGDPVTFAFDAAEAYLDVIAEPPNGGGNGGDGGNGDGGGSGGDGGGSGGDNGGGGNGGNGGGGSNGCYVPEPGTSGYPGFTYQLPTARPFVSLAHYVGTDTNQTAYARFRYWADEALAGNPPYAYSAVSSVVMHGIVGDAAYIDDAIARVEAFVTEEEQAISQGHRPSIAGDSYLEIGWYLEQLALAYDHGHARLTDGQRARWVAYAEQALFNLWHPSEASWGGVSYPWSGWSTCDPGNNYHFHFLRATMFWALASRNAAWFEFLQTEKFPALVAYYAQLPGGGTREGTGYGTAIRALFENFMFWKDSTGEDLSALTAHPRETIDYWVHATVPTMDRFAPIGDQSRSSLPELFDYQENLVHVAVALNPGTAEAARGTWWLQNNSVQGVAYAFNLLGDLLPLPDVPAAPSELVYHATGAGVLFARSAWTADASWLAFVAGKYDQSHAHQDQGSFTFFKGDWLAVTPNIWSHSGIHQETEVHNTVRFERADGTVIGQNPSDSVESTMTWATNATGGVTVTAQLANAFGGSGGLVQGWTRTLEYQGDVLRVFDECVVGSGVRPVFQLQVPVAPVVLPDGSLLAGNLRIVPLQAMSHVVHDFAAADAAEFGQGYRIDFTSAAGTTFGVELRAETP